MFGGYSLLFFLLTHMNLCLAIFFLLGGCQCLSFFIHLNSMLCTSCRLCFLRQVVCNQTTVSEPFGIIFGFHLTWFSVTFHRRVSKTKGKQKWSNIICSFTLHVFGVFRIKVKMPQKNIRVSHMKIRGK